VNILSTKKLFVTPFLELVEIDYVDHLDKRRKWYGVRRVGSTPAVAVAALTEAGEIILIKQCRPMLGGETIELPAGLMDVEGETVLETAARELLEETGYVGNPGVILVGGTRGLTVTAGITDERIWLVLITGARKVAEPFTNEGTLPFLAPLIESFNLLKARADAGVEVDYKLFGTIRLLERAVQPWIFKSSESKDKR
jgi:8-oxo-dGTP pyrophosphatase MutT (NUDIX family)